MEPLFTKTIKYKLPLFKRTIEIPEKCRNKAIAVACASTLEAGTAAAFTLGGIATREPMFTGVGLAIFGHLAGSIAMIKGSLWDFAGNFAKKNEITNNILRGIIRKHHSENIGNLSSLKNACEKVDSSNTDLSILS